MRKITMLTVLAAALALPAAAYGIVTLTYTASVTPSKAGTSAAPKATYFKGAAALASSDNTAPQQTKALRLAFDKNLVFNGKYFGFCDPAKLNTNPPNSGTGQGGDAKCAKAKVGTATANATIIENNSKISFKVTLYNGRLGNSLVVLVQLPGTGINQAFSAPLVRASGPYGRQANIVIPNSLTVVAGFHPTLTAITISGLGQGKSVRAKIGKKTRTVGFLESVGCAGGKYALRIQFVFGSTSQPDLTKETTSACRK